MRIVGKASNSDGWRLEMELDWGVGTMAIGRYVGKIRLFHNDEWVETGCCMDPKLAVKSFHEDAKKYGMTINQYEEEGNSELEKKRFSESIKMYVEKSKDLAFHHK